MLSVVRQNLAERNHLSVNIEILKDKDTSIQLDQRFNEIIKVYTDRLVHNGKVGVAAILMRQGKADCMLRLCLGTIEQHSVSEAELVSILLGLHLIATEKQNCKRCAIGLDSQAVIKALQSELTNPGHHLAAEALRTAKHLQNRNRNANYTLTIRWTVGHVGIEGNKKADKEVKKAVDKHSSKKEDLPKYVHGRIKHSISTLWQANNKERNKAWIKEWQASTRHKCFMAMDTIPPASQKFLTLISDHRISQKLASLISQLRVSHAPLNNYLFYFKKTNSTRCPACSDLQETVEHFLLQCPKYAHKWWPLQAQLNRTHPSLIDILSNPKIIILLINYIDATKRFCGQYENKQQ